MKYSCSIDLLLPRDRAVALFDDPANLRRWQKTLRSVELLSGSAGQVGARSRHLHRNGSREMAMEELITVRELPGRFAGTYTMPGMWTSVDNRFEAVDEDHTRWTADVEVRFDGFLMKLMAMLAPNLGRKQTQQLMQQFKEFAESQTDEGFERTRFVP